MFAFGDEGWGDELAAGAAMTLALAGASLAFGLLLGLLGAGAKLARSRWLNALGEAYTTLIRGVPELLVIFLVFFGGGFLLQAAAAFVGYEGHVEVNAFAAGVVALSLVFGAFATEVFRGAFLAVPEGQIEAARALGMSAFLTFRRVLLPQVWRFALPGLGNLWLVLVKDTSLVSVIALDELARKTQIAVGVEKQPFTLYLAAALIYCAITLVSSAGQGRLERWASRGVRRA
jgi:His/Glu/Gln/Arg/opine family amino acid ABC transporter permease subunit